jgi:hypothetical protein
MKRFTETDKWTRDAWFCDLEPLHKLFWLYIVDNCDNVGVWEVNVKIANLLIGTDFRADELVGVFSKKIHIFDDGCKWWIRSFIDFQHGELSEDSKSKPIMSYIALLKKHTLWEGYAKGIQRVQGKGKGKGEGKGTERAEDDLPANDYTEEFELVWNVYPKKINKLGSFRSFEKTKTPSVSTLVNAINKQKLSDDWTKESGRYIPSFSNWISDKRWEDEVEVAKPKDPNIPFDGYNPPKSLAEKLGEA